MYFNPILNDRKLKLRSVFEESMQYIDQHADVLASQEKSIAEQVMIGENEPVSLPQPRYTEDAAIKVSRFRTFEAAAQYPGQKVAVLNFASATNPGGGVTRGSSAQEECLCRVSTLYNCLNTSAMWQSFYTPHRKAQNPLHNDDIIYTPDVCVFRDDDHAYLTSPFFVDVITCAAPNLRETPSNIHNSGDGSVRAVISEAQLQALHEQRARRILSAAAVKGAEVVILGAFGCGAFKNDPEVVARAYKTVLPEFKHYFRTIEFAIYCRPGSDGNYRAFLDCKN